MRLSKDIVRLTFLRHQFITRTYSRPICYVNDNKHRFTAKIKILTRKY